MNNRSFALAASLVLAGSPFAAAQAADAPAAASLPPAYIIHKLSQDGIKLRALETERGAYEARVEATDGTLVKVGVDPQTAELTDAYSRAAVRTAEGPAPVVNAAEAISAVAATGYWDVQDISFKRGAWRVSALDDNGKAGRFTVDGTSGAIR
jgi:hypothetical protein